MKWSEIRACLDAKGVSAAADVAVLGVQYDSRRVRAGDLFVAMRGESVDGNRFVDQALTQGAVAIVTDSVEVFGRLSAREFPCALVENGRRALADAAAGFYGEPADKLAISAVTGTNGKTTTAFLLEQMLQSVGRKCVLLGTIETHIADEIRVSEHTTPESRDVLAVFAEGVAAGCTEAVMEMSSHALEQERVWGMPVDVAMFSNLTQDHLDYHGTMENYAQAKAKLFAGVGARAPRIAVINADDRAARLMEQTASDTGCEVWMYGIESKDGWGPAYRARGVAMAPGRTAFEFRTPEGTIEVESPLTGRVNVYNLLAAGCAALARGLTLEEMAAAAKKLKQVPGRFEVVPGSHEAGFTVVVDYAHTDDALQNLLGLARDLVGTGRVITMFGCGGDRDRTKRPKMGRVAASMSDFAVVTSDNPRSEEPMTIIDEVVAGMREELGMYAGEFVVEEDRRAAIEVAIRAAKPGDIVLLAGKGHEKVQIFAEGTVPFDDVEEATRVLRVLKIEEA